MPNPPSPVRLPFFAGRHAGRWAAAAVFLAAVLAYANSLSAPFIFDDSPGIIFNVTIRRLWSWDVLSPPGGGSGVQSRPLINLSLALNYALGGAEVWGYHLFNVLVHAAAGLVLFGLVRRTLLQPPLAARWGPAALPLAFTVAALWTVHPLQTESVTCVMQRTESLMGFFYLLTLYLFVRGTDPAAAHPGRWCALSIFSCLLGMASKEVMVTAPLLVLLYDRTFVAGTFRAAWQRRRPFYLGLAATWLLLAFLVWDSGGQRGPAAGFGLGMTPWTYLLTQCEAIVHYLRLVIWPHPLILDYGWPFVQSPLEVAPQALLLLALAGGTLLALRRHSALGFAGAWFFLILAPSSSVVPLVAQTIAEHRMYLPLAAVLAVTVCGLHTLLGRRSYQLFFVLALVLGGVTVRRNLDYRSELSICEVTVRDRPGNARMHHNLAIFYEQIPGRESDAIAEYETALRLLPSYAEANYDLACLLAKLPGRAAGAERRFAEALRLRPGYPAARNEFGLFLARAGRPAEALPHFAAACRLDPDYTAARTNLGNTLMMLDRAPEAILHYERVLRLQPGFAPAHNNLGIAFFKAGRLPEAVASYRRALQLNPRLADAHANLGEALLQLHDTPAARFHLEAALRLNPALTEVRDSLAKLPAAASFKN